MDPTTLPLLFFVFVLAMLLGIELITKVPSQLHTPLMSGSSPASLSLAHLSPRADPAAKRRLQY